MGQSQSQAQETDNKKDNMAFVGERHRLEGDISAKELQRALWTNPPPVRLMPGVPRKLDARGRQQIKKDCDEVFPQIIIGTGDCIKDLDFMLDLQITHVINPCEQEIRLIPPSMPNRGSVTRALSARTC